MRQRVVLDLLADLDVEVRAVGRHGQDGAGGLQHGYRGAHAFDLVHLASLGHENGAVAGLGDGGTGPVRDGRGFPQFDLPGEGDLATGGDELAGRSGHLGPVARRGTSTARGHARQPGASQPA